MTVCMHCKRFVWHDTPKGRISAYGKHGGKVSGDDPVRDDFVRR